MATNSGITPELCEMLSRLSYEEWVEVYRFMNDSFHAKIERATRTMRCDVPGDEIFSRLSVMLD